jgi:acyl dehydratase
VRYLEDLPVGETIALGTTTVDEAEMIAFGKRFDPQTFHTDPVGALATSFGGVIASGWFTGSLFASLYVSAFLSDVDNLGGLGIDEIRFPHPVRGGDVLSAEILVAEARPSERKPDRGTLKVDGTLRNQDGIVVLTLSISIRVLRRPASAS